MHILVYHAVMAIRLVNGDRLKSRLSNLGGQSKSSLTEKYTHSDFCLYYSSVVNHSADFVLLYLYVHNTARTNQTKIKGHNYCQCRFDFNDTS